MSLFTFKMIIEIIAFATLAYTLYSYSKTKKELSELKVKHKITMDFADKLSIKLLELEKANTRVKSNGTASIAKSNGTAKKAPYKKTRRSKKKKSPNTSNSGSSK